MPAAAHHVARSVTHNSKLCAESANHNCTALWGTSFKAQGIKNLPSRGDFLVHSTFVEIGFVILLPGKYSAYTLLP